MYPYKSFIITIFLFDGIFVSNAIEVILNLYQLWTLW